MTVLMRKAFLVLVTSLSLALVSGAGKALAGDDEEGPVVPPEEMQAKVRTAVAVEGDLAVRVHALAVVVSRPDLRAAVTAQVAGLVVKVEAMDGAAVKVGAALVRLDPRPFEEALAKAEAAVKAAKADLDRARAYSLDADAAELDRAAVEARALVAPAKKEADRLAGLLEKGLASAKAAADARLAAESAERAAAGAESKSKAFREKGRGAEVTQLEAAVAVAQAEVAPATRALEASVIRAPSSGRVCCLSVTEGRSIDAGTVVAQVLADEGYALRLGLALTDAAEVALGAAADVEGRDWTGTVLSIGGGIDPETGLVPVIIGLAPAAEHPRLGETLLVDVDRGQAAHGLLLPATALEVREDVPVVVAVDKECIAHVVPVELLARGADRILVKGKGLAAGDRVAVEGNYNLPDGAHVVVETGEGHEPPAPPPGTGGK